MESQEILTMRAIAWEKAKCELNSYLQTFWPSYNRSGGEIDNGFKESEKKIKAFIDDFEGWCR